MCGILAIYHYQGDVQAFRPHALQLSKKLRHRGPDWSGCVVKDNNVFCHERLAIVGVDSGAQPLTSVDETLVLCVNGEIYNHKALEQSLQTPATFKTHSDCEVIMHLYREAGVDTVKQLDGMFSFVLYDATQDRLIAARDPVGITTLYRGYDSRHPDTVYFASELKALSEDCDRIEAFPPGHVFDSATGQTTRYYEPAWFDPQVIPTAPIDYARLRGSLVQAVNKRLMSEVPYGVLLSGGLDSSLIASIAVRETAKRAREAAAAGSPAPVEAGGADQVVRRLHSFSVGLPGSPDLAAAAQVAKFLGTAHHSFTFTPQEGHDALQDVIYHLETYDVTTVRASTPMYLLSRKVKATGVKMVLSGEGSDEIFGGYLYFHYAPSADDLHRETLTRVKNLHTSDCLRANKSTMAWGLEARVPFLDRDFLEVAMSVDPQTKLCDAEHMEKYIIRRAFDAEQLKEDGETDTTPYLPDSILWRQKEQFSDGVGYSWIDSLRDLAEVKVSDAEFTDRATRWPEDTPSTKEAYYYRHLFELSFPQPACAQSVVRWIPRTDWGCSDDPSGRAQKIHSAAYKAPPQ
ncbi:asparagine synthetase [Tieghemiomyces parasiticus]|uniref:asparagine synthase (glutamine-hydrolyzing) n=1 Tax=Tieghemiomyces parasiticus TaxID=78921 RepID=A0A9W8AFG0_9FUNG|nr:asparagine synthetase [Tieghemiomyces parasiticus]